MPEVFTSINNPALSLVLWLATICSSGNRLRAHTDICDKAGIWNQVSQQGHDFSTRPHYLWALGRDHIYPRWMMWRAFSLNELIERFPGNTFKLSDLKERGQGGQYRLRISHAGICWVGAIRWREAKWMLRDMVTELGALALHIQTLRDQDFLRPLSPADQIHRILIYKPEAQCFYLPWGKQRRAQF